MLSGRRALSRASERYKLDATGALNQIAAVLPCVTHGFYARTYVTVWSHNLFMDAAFVHGIQPPALIIRINRAAEIIQIGATRGRCWVFIS